MPDRIQRKRTPGWRLPKGAMIVDRSSRWGNPFVVGEIHRAGVGDWSHPNPRGLWEAYFHYRHGAADTEAGQAYRQARERLAAAHAVALFRALAAHFAAVDPEAYAAWLAPLRGKTLACPCEIGMPCHADVLLELANA